MVISDDNAMPLEVSNSVLKMIIKVDFGFEWDDRTDTVVRFAMIIEVEDVGLSDIGVNYQRFRIHLRRFNVISSFALALPEESYMKTNT